LFITQHEVDDWTLVSDEDKKLAKMSLEEKYKLELERTRAKQKKIYDLAKEFNIQLLGEKELNVSTRNLLKCEESEFAFQDIYKKGTFFETLDSHRLKMEKRLSII